MRQICIAILILTSTLFTNFASEPKHQPSKKERFKQYLIGIHYLENARDFSIEEKISYYKQLVKITGFTAEMASDYIERYKDNPEKWIKLINSVIEIINNPDSSDKE